MRVTVVAYCVSVGLMACIVRPSASEKCPDKCNCSTYNRRISCEHKDLHEIPKDIPTTATLLYLGYNKLAVIETGSFSTLRNLTNLSLINNIIGNLQNRSFLGLQNLKSLFLRKNKLVSIERDAFWDLVSLQRLYLTDNYLTSVPDLSFAPNLIYLTLDTNDLTNADLCNNSATFNKLSTIKLADNENLTRIRSDDFKCVNRQSVRNIDIARCNVKEFDNDVFRFPHLQSLSLSYNSIPYDMLKRIFNSIVPSDLTSLDLSGVLQPIRLMPSDLFANLTGLKLNHLSLAHTSGVNVIQNGTFRYLPYLRYLDLSYSDFTEIFDDTSLSLLTNLTRISLSHNKVLSKIPKLNSTSLEILELDYNQRIETLESHVFSGLPNLRNLSLQSCWIRTIFHYSFSGLTNLVELKLANNRLAGNAIPKRALAVMQNLKVLDLGSNKITIIATEYDVFVGLNKLQRLDFSNNLCLNVSTRIFKPLLNLEHLNLAGNQLGGVIGSDTEGQLFSSLNKLKYLGLDGNHIAVLPPRLLAGLDKLQLLNLSNNHLADWPEQMIDKSTPLDMVDFSSNKIATVSERELLTLPERTRLNLTGNPFSCGCDLIWFGRWIRGHNSSDGKLAHLDSYKCNSPDAMARKPLVQFNPEDIVRSCHPLPIKWILTGACSAVFAVMLFSTIIAYRYRWKLRLKYFYLRRRFRSPTGQTFSSEANDFEYDIFVSYGPADKDRNWVKSELMPRFIRIDDAVRGTDEESAGTEDNDDQNNSERQSLLVPDGPDEIVVASGDDQAKPVPILGKKKVFIEEESATFGKLEFHTLAESMHNSHKVILVVSDEYLKDGRRLVEIELATRSRVDNNLSFDSIIVVFLEPAVDVTATPRLLSIVDKKDRLYWTEDDLAGQELFWHQLAEAIQSRPDTTLLSP